LKFIIFGQSSVTTQITNNVAALMDTTTKAYAPAKISFEWSINVNPSTEFNGLDPSQSDLVTKMKSSTADSPATQLNIWVPQTLKAGLLGWAIFPIDPAEALSDHGGVVMTYAEVNSGKWTLPHEMGHAFGLLHPHESSPASGGVAVQPCDVCCEFAGNPSDIKGDLISDTPPTLENYKCANPTSGDCRGNSYGATDYYNIMGYAPNSCFDVGGHFTQQQQGRMRCFLERNLVGWLSSARKCQVVADCDDNNACTFETCVSGSCQTRLKQCGNSTVPCTDLTCDPVDGNCKPSPRVCKGPAGLSCAKVSCDVRTNACVADFSTCAPPAAFQHDCCTTSPSPFCNDSAIINCVCTAYSLDCCTKGWDVLCTDIVAHCSDTRDCLAETLPEPTNPSCATAALISDGATSIFKADNQDVSSFNCLGVDVTSDGAWWYITGATAKSFSVDTCFIETAVVPTIYVFDKCPKLGGVCSTKAISSSSCTAQLTLNLDPSQTAYIFVSSPQYGTIRADFKTTAAPSGLPLGAIIALVVLSIFAVLVIILIIYMLFQKNQYTDLP